MSNANFGVIYLLLGEIIFLVVHLGCWELGLATPQDKERK